MPPAGRICHCETPKGSWQSFVKSDIRLPRRACALLAMTGKQACALLAMTGKQTCTFLAMTHTPLSLRGHASGRGNLKQRTPKAFPLRGGWTRSEAERPDEVSAEGGRRPPLRRKKIPPGREGFFLHRPVKSSRTARESVKCVESKCAWLARWREIRKFNYFPCSINS